MRPMFSYLGSKYKLSPKYGAPRFDTVIEPFAGSAAYSLFWEPRRVILMDKSPVIVSIWQYLISASAEDIMALPVDFHSTADLDVSQGAKNLIEFWIGKGKSSPGITKSKWGREYANSGDCKVWGEQVKIRIASQVDKIRHWEVIEGDYTEAPDISAHWFIDPPYAVAGRQYPFKNIDYAHLAEWSKERKGFIQVCENEGADWLPFETFHSVNTYHHIKAEGKRKAKHTHEVIYELSNPVDHSHVTA